MAKVSLRNYIREIEAQIDRGQLDEAIAHCQHILKTFPKHLESYRLLGKAYLEYKRYKDAVDIFSRVLAAEPNDFVSNVGMSIIRDEENKLDDAIWHMERAFETQSANPAIQGELQRLYSRRDGVQPPRIRMTRGALAHMYVQGELYPQAISEIKSVLREDQGRSDMQILLARAYFKSGQKNDAADAANSVLRRYPYNFEANRVLVEILGADRPESAQAYRQRVIELDPYAAQVSGSIFQTNEVGDNAVMIEHFEWNGQPVGMQSDWNAKAIAAESGSGQQTQPDWLKSGFGESAPPASPKSAPSLPASTSASNVSAPSAPMTVPTNNEDIPEFLRAAGWGQSTGAFDESKSSFADEPTPNSPGVTAPLAEGDLPDWVKAMMPAQAAQPPAQQVEEAPSAQDEELPDWIKNIGTGALRSALPESSDAQPEWMQPSEPASTPNEQPDWMKGLDQAEPASQAPASDDSLDWLKGFDANATASQPASESQPDWMKDFSAESELTSAAGKMEQPDWLTQTGNQTEEPASAAPQSDFDFFNDLAQQPEASAPASFAEAPQKNTGTSQDKPASNVQDLGKSQSEIDDSLAWLENLAAKQGATEGLLVKPEDRMEKEPDWIQQVKSEPTPASFDQAPTPAPTSNVEDLGKSQSEIDDSLAWLENLAAKQGATEGLLVKPEDRMEKEPDWIQQVKSEPAPTPTSNVEDLGKSQSEIDDSLAWLENLAAKQGATEGLLVKPEDRMEKEPDWIQQVKSEPAPASNVEDLGKSQSEIDDSLAWLENLAAKQGATEGLLVKPEDRMDKEPDWIQQVKSAPIEPTPAPEPVSAPSDDMPAWLRGLDKEEESAPEPAADATAMWLKSLDEPEATLRQVEPSAPSDDLPGWLQGVESEAEKTPVAEAVVPEREAGGEFDWLDEIEEESAAVSPAPVVASEEDVPSWLKGMDDESKVPTAPDDAPPAWMRDETGEVVAEPTKIEPTRATDWKPADKQLEPPVQEQPKPQPKPEPVAPAKPKPEPKKAAPKPEPYEEPMTMKSAGTASMPVDPMLGSARNELSRSNIPGALEGYEKLIKKGRFLDEVIFDLREALYRYPVEVSIWQSLGDAYMRANRLQDALDAYTKAEELLR